MSIKLNTDYKQTDAAIHLMPCNIEHDGDANVEAYFDVIIEESTNKDIKHASFRGRPLAGKVLKVPNGYQGLVVTEKNKSYSDHQDRKLQVETSFKNYTYWNLETTPTSSDAVVSAFDWLEVANVLHNSGPVKNDKEKGMEESEP